MAASKESGGILIGGTTPNSFSNGPPSQIDVPRAPSNLSIQASNSRLSEDTAALRAPLRCNSQYSGQLGGKTIGFFGSFVLITNNITGPGMLHIAAVFQQAGVAVPMVVFVVICLCSAGAATLLCDAMARMPGNEEFDVRVEYSDIFSHFLGPRSFIWSQIGFFLGIFTQAAASIIGTAQSMDSLIAFCFGRTWALHVTGPRHTPWFLEWSPHRFCGDNHRLETRCVPFSHLSHKSGHDIGLVLSAGYMLTLVSMMPLGFLNLDDNIKFQILSFFILVVLCIEFVVEMCVVQGQDPTLMPIIGSDYSSMLGTILFNFAYCPTLPSWMNEKKKNVSTSGTLWTSALFSTLMYVLLGATGAMAYPNAEANLLQVLGAPRSSPVTRICSYLFGVLVIGMGIPVFCIVMRYNLVVGGFGTVKATFSGVVLPWLVSWLLYQGSAAQYFIGISGVVLISAIGFVLPLIGALAAVGVTWRQMGFHRGCRLMWAATWDIGETVVHPLPNKWLQHQRRYVSALLVILVPGLLAGLAGQMQSL